ncbi:MAG: hypothetical protein ACW98Y_14150 [Candidatus Thorarchaeota archaeon]|jgi:hypothetical protein
MTSARSRWFGKLTVMTIVFAFVSTLAICPMMGSAALVWSDNFDDGDYNGWTVTDGSFSIENGALNSDSSWSTIVRNSSIDSGTWSFDIFVESDNDTNSLDCAIFFIVGDYEFPTDDSGGFSDMVDPYGLFFSENLLMLIAGPSTIEHYETTTEFTGWWHIDITRDSDGTFSLFINDFFYMAEIDTLYSESGYFVFWSRENCMLDNIVVSDSIDIVQQWYDFGPFTWWTYVQFGCGFVFILMTVYIIARPPKAQKTAVVKPWLLFALLAILGAVELVTMIGIGDRTGILVAITQIIFSLAALFVEKRERMKLSEIT